MIEGVNPEPWRASEGNIGRKAGKMFVQMHKPGTVRDYQEAFKEEFAARYPDFKPYSHHMAIDLWYWRQMTNIADATNLQKSTEDALQGLLYHNDQQVKYISSYIMEQFADTEPAILIRIKPIPAEHHLLGLDKRAELALPVPDAVSNIRRNVDVDGIF